MDPAGWGDFSAYARKGLPKVRGRGWLTKATNPRRSNSVECAEACDFVGEVGCHLYRLKARRTEVSRIS